MKHPDAAMQEAVLKNEPNMKYDLQEVLNDERKVMRSPKKGTEEGFPADKK